MLKLWWLQFWPIVGWVNYQYMPLQFRVLFHSFVASCWYAALFDCLIKIPVIVMLCHFPLKQVSYFEEQETKEGLTYIITIIWIKKEIKNK